MNNQTLTDIANRRSVRLYKQEAVSGEKLEAVLAAAKAAPSARNYQPIHIRVVQKKTILDELNADFKRFVGEETPAYTGWQSQPFYHYAPVFIMLFGEKDKHYAPVDSGIMVENIALAAQSVGLGSCIIGCVGAYLNSEESAKWRERFEVPENCDFCIGITLGEPDEAPAAKPRENDRVKFIEE